MGLLIISCILVGCSKPMTNEQIIQEKNKCLAANMDYQIWLSGLDYKVMRVTCTYPSSKNNLETSPVPEKVEK